MTENVPESALLACFGAMSNVGMMSGLEAIEALKQVEHGKAGFKPAVTINLVTDCAIRKKPASQQYNPDEMKPATKAIVSVILSAVE
jgi:hypothetical protein